MNKNYKRRKAAFQEPVLVLLRIVIKNPLSLLSPTKSKSGTKAGYSLSSPYLEYTKGINVPAILPGLLRRNGSNSR
jgi:hypothetical protein